MHVKFYDLQVFKLWGCNYFLKLRATAGESMWVLFVTESMLREVEQITRNKAGKHSKKGLGDKRNKLVRTDSEQD